MSMAHALEVRVPFVDPVVINYVLGLPGEWKTNGGRPKPLLVDALGDLLPEEICNRRKMGFTLPFERWMTSALRVQLDDCFSNGAFENIGINAACAREIWEAFKHNPKQESWSRAWGLYVLQRWCETHQVEL
jgi:asparagine synthase (glutamine-hydrolysing)